MQAFKPAEKSTSQLAPDGVRARPQADQQPDQLQVAVDSSPRMVAQRQRQEALDKSPRQVAQRQQAPTPRANTTGLPDQLKAGVESLSGHSLDDVTVHYNSSKPAQLQAHAYAQGTDIHVAPGQEQHLPHEAWHVAQQKQGRVQATMQLKAGVAVNDDTGLEREADVMGAKALQMQATPDASASTQLAQSAPQADGPVQRKVGFEFETSWLVHREEIPSKEGKEEQEKIPAKEGKEEEKEEKEPAAPKLRALAKKEKIGTSTYTGFKLEADEAGEDNSEIEFITDPIDEMPANLEEMAGIMSAMQALGEKLLAFADQRQFSLDQATGQAGDRVFIITPRDTSLSAGPQVTSGIDMAKIATLESHRGAGALAPAELQGSLGSIEDTARQISPTAQGASPQLLGLLTLIVSYLQTGRGRIGDPGVADFLHDPSTRHGLALNYPKRIAEPLLARTQFGKLFQLLPKREQLFYADHPRQWLDLVINAAGGYALYDPLGLVIARGIRQEDTGFTDTTVNEHGPRRVEWILGIPAGVDRVAQMEDAESMGEFGDKTEEVGPGHVEAGIFEFRGAQARKIALAEWPRFAMEFFRYILTLHDHSLPVDIPKKKT